MNTREAPRAGRKEWLGLLVLALPTFLVSIDIFVLLLALPELTRALGASSNQQLWATDMYGFTMAGFVVTMGTLGDRIGRRRILLIGATAFGIISVVAAYSTSAEMLIVCRALLGIAGATLMPSTLALISTMFQDDAQRGRALGLWGGTFTLGAIAGPAIGGVLLTSFWWGSVFLLAAPVMVILVLVGPKLLPESKNPSAGRLDPLSVALSLAAILPIVYGIKQLARDGWAVLPELALVIGFVAGVLFVQRQGRLAFPLLDLRLLANRAIGAALTSQLGYAVVGGGTMLFMMLYFQLVQGMSTLAAGSAMIPGMASATVGFMVVTPYLAARIRPAYVIATGMLGSAAALFAFTTVGVGSGTATLIIGFSVFAFCGSPLVALGTGVIMGSAPPEQAGSAGSLAQMSNEFGGTLGNALIGTLGFAVYRHQAADLLPPGLSPSSSALARDSIAGATEVAAGAPDGLRVALLEAARQAFVSGLHTAAAVGSVILAAVAVLVVTRLRHLPPVGSQQLPVEPAADSFHN